MLLSSQGKAWYPIPALRKGAEDEKTRPLVGTMAVALVVASGVALTVNKIGTNGTDFLVGTNGDDNLVGILR